MQDPFNEKYQLACTQAIQHVAASNARLLYLYKWFMCVSSFDIVTDMRVTSAVSVGWVCAWQKNLAYGDFFALQNTEIVCKTIR